MTKSWADSRLRGCSPEAQESSAPTAKALARAGFEPGDFGSYNHVKQRIREAKRRVRDAKPGAKPGKPGGRRAPTTGSWPSPPTGTCNRTRCSSGSAGTTARTRSQARAARVPPATTSGWRPALRFPRGPSGRTAERATGPAARQRARSPRARRRVTRSRPARATRSHGTPSAWRRRGRPGATSRVWRPTPGDVGRRSATRARPARARSARRRQGRSRLTREGKKAAVDEDSAEKCIESWMKLANEAMRRQVMQDYSEENYPATKKKLEKAERDAKRAAKDAGRIPRRRTRAATGTGLGRPARTLAGPSRTRRRRRRPTPRPTA